MRIDDLNRAAQPQPAERADRAGEHAKNDPASHPSSDQVDISQLAHSLSHEGADRLDQLRLQVQKGPYQIEPGEVAKALIADHLKDRT